MATMTVIPRESVFQARFRGISALQLDRDVLGTEVREMGLLHK